VPYTSASRLGVTGIPGLIVFNTCKHLIRTLPALCYSKSHPEDVNTDSEDHLFDATRYALTRRVTQVQPNRGLGGRTDS
jgi:hypothetical protein